MHYNWFAYFRTWRRRSLFSGRAPTCRSPACEVHEGYCTSYQNSRPKSLAASLRASSPRTRTRSRSPAPLPKRAPRAPTPQLQCCFWSAWLCCPRGVGTGHGLGHQELPTSPASPAAPLTCCSCPPRCLDRVSAPRCRFWILRSHRSCPRGLSGHGVFVQLRRRMGRAP